MAHIFKAPNRVPNELMDDKSKFSIFLAGTIDMGNSYDWQSDLTDKLVEKFGDKIIILNPRRDDWDSSWEQSINNLHFKEQVEWELEYIDNVDLRFIHFSENSKSPITLLELGACTNHELSYRTIVYCPEGFYRKGNVDVVCDRYDIQQISNVDDILVEISKLMKYHF